MQLQAIPRTAVRTYLEVARLPLTAVGALVRPAKRQEWPPALAFETFGASVKQLVGTVVRDEELVYEGRLAKAKVAQLRQAVELETIGEQQRAEADAEFEQRREVGAQRREELQGQAAEREGALNRQKAEEKRWADDKARKRAASVRKTQAATDKQVAKQQRAARSTRVRAERQALSTARRSATAQSDVTRIDNELERTRARRNQG